MTTAPETDDPDVRRQRAAEAGCPAAAAVPPEGFAPEGFAPEGAPAGLPFPMKHELPADPVTRASIAATIAVGAKYNPFDPEFLQDPHQFFAWAREEAPVCYNPVFNMWLVTGHDEVLRVCDDAKLFSSRNKVDPPALIDPRVLEILHRDGYPVANQLFNSDPPDHERIRTLVGKGFTTSRMRAQEPAVRTLANDLLDAVADSGRADLRAAYLDPLPLSGILDFLGAPREDHPQIKAWDDAWARLFTSAFAIEDQLDAVRQVVAYQKYLEGLIELRRAEPRDDLLSAMTHASVPGLEPLANDEMIWQCMGLLAAGHATTTDALTNLLLVLLTGDSRWPELAAEPSRIPSYIDEGLRLVNPVLGLPRITTEAVELGGVTIPKGGEVLVSFCSAGRDGTAIPEPDDFVPTRPGVGGHLGFGRGIHYCIGARIAKMMMRVALETMAERLPALELEAGYQPRHTVHPFLWGLAELPVQWAVPGP